MYEGLSTRTRWLRWSLFLMAVAIVLVGTAQPAVGSFLSWVGVEFDRLPWYITRTTALLAYLAITGSVIYGLLLSTKILDRIAHRAVSFTLHQDLASIGLALALVHVAVLMLDRSVPYSPFELIVPFSGPYRPLWVGIGQLALALTLLVTLSFYVRKRIGQPLWRRLHYLSFVAFVGASVHGLMAGTDTQAAWVFWGYLLMITTVVFLLTYRIVMSVDKGPARRPAAGSGGSTTEVTATTPR
jgi:DMSO/TMAO reductase YedYZ heme-binding membrane subunit